MGAFAQVKVVQLLAQLACSKVCFFWRWGAFDGPSPSRNAGRVCMVTGDLHTRSSNTSVEHAPRESRETRGTMQLTDGRSRPTTLVRRMQTNEARDQGTGTNRVTARSET